MIVVRVSVWTTLCALAILSRLRPLRGRLGVRVPEVACHLRIGALSRNRHLVPTVYLLSDRSLEARRAFRHICAVISVTSFQSRQDGFCT